MAPGRNAKSARIWQIRSQIHRSEEAFQIRQIRSKSVPAAKKAVDLVKAGSNLRLELRDRDAGVDERARPVGRRGRRRRRARGGRGVCGRGRREHLSACACLCRPCGLVGSKSGSGFGEIRTDLGVDLAKSGFTQIRGSHKSGFRVPDGGGSRLAVDGLGARVCARVRLVERSSPSVCGSFDAHPRCGRSRHDYTDRLAALSSTAFRVTPLGN